jgi:uncharacterized protein (DUF983 family)
MKDRIRANLDALMSATNRATVIQAGGKYGMFTCPVCGGDTMYDWSNNVADCEACGTEFIHSTGCSRVDLPERAALGACRSWNIAVGLQLRQNVRINTF